MCEIWYFIALLNKFVIVFDFARVNRNCISLFIIRVVILCVKFDVLLHWTIKCVIVFEFVWVKRNCVRLLTKLSSWQLATFFFRPVIWVVIYLSCLWNLIRDILRSIEKLCNPHLLFQDLFLTEKHCIYINILGLRKKRLVGG